MSKKIAEKDKKMFRINASISADLNNWLDSESANTGYTKTTLIMLAIENYKQQKTALAQMTEITELVEKLEKLSQKLDD